MLNTLQHFVHRINEVDQLFCHGKEQNTVISKQVSQDVEQIKFKIKLHDLFYLILIHPFSF